MLWMSSGAHTELDGDDAILGLFAVLFLMLLVLPRWGTREMSAELTSGIVRSVSCDSLLSLDQESLQGRIGPVWFWR
jgi:hypothetical protein